IAGELFLIFALSSQPAEIPTFIPVALVTAVLFFHVFSLERAPLSLLVTGGLAAVALWPLYFAVWREASGADLSGTALRISAWPLETIGLAALALWGAYHAVQALRRWLRERRLPTDGSVATAAYVAATFLAIAATTTEPSYKLFVWISGALGVALVAVFRRHFDVILALAAVGVALAIMGFWQFTFGVLGAAAVISVIDWVNTLSLSTRVRWTSAVIAIAAVGLFFRFTDIHTTKPGLFTIALGALALAGVALRARAGSGPWRVALATLALAGIAFSVNTYVPIRSAQGPAINQNNPSRSINAFVGYFERKQYGSQSMITRMFTRRAEWKNQFGSHQRMGFAGFFREQFGGNAGTLAIVVVLGALGVWELTRRSPGRGAVFITVLLLGTVGLVLYMNFADGTRMIGGRDYLEVRDRDYFFTPGFMFFGLAIGLGVAALMQIVRDSLANATRLSGPVTSAVAVAALALPALAIADNFESCNRSGNYIPYDYAKNLLDSAEPNAVLVTGGDNDTFPLWALQEVYNYRTDVAVMILSLSNTDWYLKHMRDFWDVPLELTDEQIDALRPVRHPDGRIDRIQDQIVDYLVLTQPTHQRPINFAVTVSPGQRRLRGQSMENRLTLRGRAYRVRPDSTGFAIDYPATDSLYTQVFAFRSLGKDGVNQNATSRGMTNGYATGFLLLADHYRAQRDWDNALRVMSRAYEILPGLVQVSDEYVRILAAAGRVAEIYPILELLPEQHMLDIVKRWVQRARGDGRIQEAITALTWAHERAPEERDVFYGLVALELEHKNYETVERLLSGWVAHNPQDSTAAGLLNQLQRGMQQGEL
ncbi:MAG TPA: tetratricopeptide repeat protein, partial [candidate division Zixibacteria bacterium]|nr:tetratricopeptide repeat protein [candidate division Zixibacteria bacterium]